MSDEMPLRMAVLCPSEIARRRFAPALASVPGAEYAGVGVATARERGGDPQEARDRSARQRETAEEMRQAFGGRVWESFDELLCDPAIDAVYIPLPPALHFPWALRALEAGKHVMLEKPFATDARDAACLLEESRRRGLAVHENYMFAFHSQIGYLMRELADGLVGELRLARVDFGFPFRGGSDFRYAPELGGGALLDCGGYALKLAAMLVGPGAQVQAASAGYGRGLAVDLFGSATVAGAGGVAQISFGMDNDYRCDVDLWGSTGTLRSGRILTAPAGFEPVFELRRNGNVETVRLEPDDSFAKSIERFLACTKDPALAERQRAEIAAQAQLVEQFRQLAGLG